MALVPFTYFNINEFGDNDSSVYDKEKRLFYVEDKVIAIKQFVNHGIGGKFWDCSILVVEYLKSHKHWYKNKNILEISSGCGLVSMVLSIWNCNVVIATELPEIWETNTKINIALNKQVLNPENIKTCELEWGNTQHLSNIAGMLSQIDYIIICECWYEEAPFDKLMKTWLELYKIYQGVEIWFAYKKRYIFQEQCLEQWKEFFVFSFVDRNEYHHEFKNKENYVMINLRFKQEVIG